MNRRVTPGHERDLEALLDLDPVLVEVGRRIMEARKKKGLTQQEVSAISGVELNSIGRGEKGTQNFTIKTLMKIAAALDCDLVDLVPSTKKRMTTPRRDAHDVADLLSEMETDIAKVALAISALRNQMTETTGEAVIGQPDCGKDAD